MEWQEDGGPKMTGKKKPNGVEAFALLSRSIIPMKQRGPARSLGKEAGLKRGLGVSGITECQGK